MATAIPAIDLFNPAVQQIRDNFERSVFPSGGFEELEQEIRRTFFSHASRPYVSALIADVLSGRWDLGTTQQEIADELGMERSRISDALRKGELALESYLALRFHGVRPADWEPQQEVLDASNRAGFIGVANFFARRIEGRQRLVQELDEFHYELVCEKFARYLEWTEARLSGTESVAITLINDVRNNVQRDIIPTRCLDEVRRHTKLLIDRLVSEPTFAFEYLCRLQDEWEDVCVATHSVTEILQWTP